MVYRAGLVRTTDLKTTKGTVHKGIRDSSDGQIEELLLYCHRSMLSTLRQETLIKFSGSHSNKSKTKSGQ